MSSKSGLTVAQRLQQGGLDAQKSSITKMWVGDLSFAPDGHPLWHARAAEPADEDLIASIEEHGFRDEFPITGFEVTITGGRKAVYVINGSRRTNAAQAAETRLAAKGKLRADKDGNRRLYVPVLLFAGTEAEALAYRLRANAEDPLKKPDSATVLAKTYAQLAAFGWEPAQIAEARGDTNLAEVASLLRFMNLPEPTRVAFDDECLPVSLIATFLDEIPAEQHGKAIAAAIQAGGCEHPRKAKTAALKAVRGDGPVKPRAGRPSKKHVQAIVSALAEKEPALVALIKYIAMGDPSTLAEQFPDKMAWVESLRPPVGRPKAQDETSADETEDESQNDLDEESAVEAA